MIKKLDNTTLYDVYGNNAKGKKTAEFVKNEVEAINKALELREVPSVVFNGTTYSKGYEYNKKKAVNYAPPKGKNDKEVSMGIIHEKIVGFIAIFLKYVFKRKIKCYDQNGMLIERLGEVYDIAIEFSQRLEKLQKKIAVIYYEVFTQGDAFVLEDWEVESINKQIAKEGGREIDPAVMDYTYEYLENLTYEEGEQIQTRRAISRLLDGRNVILDNPEIDSGIQDQEAITIEETLSRATAEKIYGTLKMWKQVPANEEDIKKVIGEKITLFDKRRLTDPKTQVLVHRRYNKRDNKFNIYVNGVAMLPMDTPLTIFYPRNNYPITQFSAERLSGSAYSRGIPAKTKFNADYIDFVLKNIAMKFEQDVDPALLVKGKYTLIKDIFKAGKRTHGVKKEDYELANPDDKGLQTAHFSFLNLIKDIIENQTVNPTTSGELSANTTATEIATVDQNQKDKLGIFLDGLINGFMEMSLRRAETIESKYTIKQKETIVDDKKISVYQNFTVNVSGIDNIVEFEEDLETNPLYDYETKSDELFQKTFADKKAGRLSKYYLINPKALREGAYIVDIEIVPEKLKDSALQLVTMQAEFDWLMERFPNVDKEEVQKEYLKITGRTDKIFLPRELQELEQEQAQAEQAGVGMGQFAKPSIKGALKSEMLGGNK